MLTVVAGSVDGGQTIKFLAALDAELSPGIDYPSIATGPGQREEGVVGGSVWVSWDNHDGAVYASGAFVGGKGSFYDFSAPQEALSGGLSSIAVGPGGVVMVSSQVYDDYADTMEVWIAVKASGLEDGDFGDAVDVTTSNVGADRTIDAQPQRGIYTEARLAWNRGGVFSTTEYGRVYLIYTDSPENALQNTNIYVMYSDDLGAEDSWGGPVLVNDDATTKSQFFPSIAIDQTTGYVAATWYDARLDTSGVLFPGGLETNLYGAISTDGESFSTNVRISNSPSNATTAEINGYTFDYGDYAGLSFVDGTFYPCWSDNSDSTSDNWDAENFTEFTFEIYTSKVVVK